MHKIVALWAVPRSTSTAFEWMMRQRGDLDCLHEPFGEAWYQGEDPLWPRFTEGAKTTPGLTLESVWDDIRARAEKGPVFLKDFPHYINHMWDPDFLANFTHAFLIRDPALRSDLKWQRVDFQFKIPMTFLPLSQECLGFPTRCPSRRPQRLGSEARLVESPGLRRRPIDWHR